MKLLGPGRQTDKHKDQAGAETAVGLLVSDGQVVQAVVRRSGERVELLSAHRAPFGNGSSVVQGEQSVQPAASSSTLTEDDYLVSAMSSADVITRCFSMPRADAERIRQMVGHRLEADLPIPLADVVWGCRSETGQANGLATVLAQAARTARVAQYGEALKQQGLRFDMLTTEAEALAALWKYGLQSSPSDGPGMDALIVASAGCLLIAIMEHDVVRAVRRVAFEDGDPERLSRSCRDAIEADTPLQKLKSIHWLATSEVEELRYLLAERLQTRVFPVQAARPLVRPDGHPVDVEVLALHGLAIGLAMVGLYDRARAICLAGEREGRRSAKGRWDRWLRYPLRWTAAALGVAVLAGLVHFGSLAGEARRMEKVLAQSQRPDAAMARLEPQIRVLERIRAWRVDVERVVAELCAKIPPDMVISSLQLSRERGLTVKGTCGDTQKIYKLVEDLRKSPRFSNVQPGRTEPGRGGAFTITADIEGTRKLTTVTGGRGR